MENKKKILTEEELLKRRDYYRKRYARDRDKVRGKSWIWQKKKIKEFEEWKSTLKCSNCDENHVSCLDFHHVNPSEKDKGIAHLRHRGERLREELKKCIVLCSNCHKKLHWAEKKGVEFPFKENINETSKETQ